MFISISHCDDNTFPENLRLDIHMDYNIYNTYEINFTINMKIFRNGDMYDKTYIGAYFTNTKELRVAEKNRMIFKNQFYEGSTILVDDLFQKYILPSINLNDKN
jgi:hypothetical protein